MATLDNNEFARQSARLHFTTSNPQTKILTQQSTGSDFDHITLNTYDPIMRDDVVELSLQNITTNWLPSSVTALDNTAINVNLLVSPCYLADSQLTDVIWYGPGGNFTTWPIYNQNYQAKVIDNWSLGIFTPQKSKISIPIPTSIVYSTPSAIWNYISTTFRREIIAGGGWSYEQYLNYWNAIVTYQQNTSSLSGKYQVVGTTSQATFNEAPFLRLQPTENYMGFKNCGFQPVGCFAAKPCQQQPMIAQYFGAFWLLSVDMTYISNANGFFFTLSVPTIPFQYYQTQTYANIYFARSIGLPCDLLLPANIFQLNNLGYCQLSEISTLLNFAQDSNNSNSVNSYNIFQQSMPAFKLVPGFLGDTATGFQTNIQGNFTTQVATYWYTTVPAPTDLAPIANISPTITQINTGSQATIYTNNQTGIPAPNYLRSYSPITFTDRPFYALDDAVYLDAGETFPFLNIPDYYMDSKTIYVVLDTTNLNRIGGVLYNGAETSGLQLAISFVSNPFGGYEIINSSSPNYQYELFPPVYVDWTYSSTIYVLTFSTCNINIASQPYTTYQAANFMPFSVNTNGGTGQASTLSFTTQAGNNEIVQLPIVLLNQYSEPINNAFAFANSVPFTIINTAIKVIASPFGLQNTVLVRRISRPIQSYVGNVVGSGGRGRRLRRRGTRR
jgi:hypothetical protein